MSRLTSVYKSHVGRNTKRISSFCLRISFCKKGHVIQSMETRLSGFPVSLYSLKIIFIVYLHQLQKKNTSECIYLDIFIDKC